MLEYEMEEFGRSGGGTQCRQRRAQCEEERELWGISQYSFARPVSVAKHTIHQCALSRIADDSC